MPELDQDRRDRIRQRFGYQTPQRRETNRDGLRAGWRSGVGMGFCETAAALFWAGAILIGLI